MARGFDTPSHAESADRMPQVSVETPPVPFSPCFFCSFFTEARVAPP